MHVFGGGMCGASGVLVVVVFGATCWGVINVSGGCILVWGVWVVSDVCVVV